MNRQPRKFEFSKAVRSQVPLLTGLIGPSGGGKTKSALELATGMQSVVGGEIWGLDTESGRMAHYADEYAFQRTDFTAPYSSLDYLDCLEQLYANGAKVIIVDSMSHEHEGEGGLIEQHEAELDRMAGNNWEKRERCNLAAWIAPKKNRKKLVQRILQMKCCFILCFRASPSTKPIKIDGKLQMVHQGFMPIAGPEFVFEMTTSMLLPPRAEGIPVWNSEYHGESMGIKLPQQFMGILNNGKPLSKWHGRMMALWAQGYFIKAEHLNKKYATVATKADFDVLEENRKALWNSVSDEDKKSMKAASEAAGSRISKPPPDHIPGIGDPQFDR